MSRGYNSAAGFAGGVYAELGLRTDEMEAKLTAAQKKLVAYRDECTRIYDLRQRGIITAQQEGNALSALTTLYNKGAKDVQDYAQALTDRLGQTPGVMDRLVASFDKLRKATGFTGQGFLQLAYAIDDVQYGFRSVVNNIPLIVTQFGGSAGLAAVAQIAAVAFNQFGPSYQDVLDKLKGTDMSQVIQDWKRWFDQLRMGRDEINGIGDDYAKMREKMQGELVKEKVAAKEFQGDVHKAESLEGRLSKEEKKKIDAIGEGIANVPGGADAIEERLFKQKDFIDPKDRERARALEKRIQNGEDARKEHEEWRKRVENSNIDPLDKKEILAHDQDLWDETQERQGFDADKNELRLIKEKGNRLAKQDARAALGNRLRIGGPLLDDMLERIEKDPNLKNVHDNIQKALAGKDKAHENRKKSLEHQANRYETELAPQMHMEALKGIISGKDDQQNAIDEANRIRDTLKDIPIHDRAKVAAALAVKAVEKAREAQSGKIGEGAPEADAAAEALQEAQEDRLKKKLAREKFRAKQAGGPDEKQIKEDAKDFHQNDAIRSGVIESLIDPAKNDGKSVVSAMAQAMADFAGGEAKPEQFKESAKLIFKSLRASINEEIKGRAFEKGITPTIAAEQLKAEHDEKVETKRLHAEEMKVAEQRKVRAASVKEAEHKVPGIGHLTQSDLARQIMRQGNTVKALNDAQQTVMNRLVDRGMKPEKAREAASAIVENQKEKLSEHLQDFLINPPRKIKQSEIVGAGEFYNKINSQLQGDGDIPKRSLQEQMKMRMLMQQLVQKKDGPIQLVIN